MISSSIAAKIDSRRCRFARGENYEILKIAISKLRVVAKVAFLSVCDDPSRFVKIPPTSLAWSCLRNADLSREPRALIVSSHRLPNYLFERPDRFRQGLKNELGHCVTGFTRVNYSRRLGHDRTRISDLVGMSPHYTALSHTAEVKTTPQRKGHRNAMNEEVHQEKQRECRTCRKAFLARLQEIIGETHISWERVF